MRAKPIKEPESELQAISALLSLTASSSSDETISEYAQALDDLDTGWIVAACDELRREWTGYRAPRPGDIRAVAKRFRKDAADARRASQTLEPPGGPYLDREGLRQLAEDMRAAMAHAARRSPAERHAAWLETLERDVARGRLSRKAADQLIAGGNPDGSDGALYGSQTADRPGVG